MGWTVRELADKSDVHRNTITRLEGGAEGETRTLAALQRVLEEAGVEFVAENGGGAGVRYRPPT